MVWTLCTSGQAIAKAGNDVNSDIKASGQTLADWSEEVESVLSDIAATDVVTDFSTYTTQGKLLLQRLSSSMIAQQMARFDLSGYSVMREAETIMDSLENDIDRDTKLLKDDDVKGHLGITS